MRGEPFELHESTVGLYRDGTSDLEPNQGKPRRIDGIVVGAPVMTQNAPHRGEMHPDGDELLYVISGHLEVILEIDNEERRTELTVGKAMIVPRGIWHRVNLLEPSHILHLTPGPGGAHRPL